MKLETVLYQLYCDDRHSGQSSKRIFQQKKDTSNPSWWTTTSFPFLQAFDLTREQAFIF